MYDLAVGDDLDFDDDDEMGEDVDFGDDEDATLIVGGSRKRPKKAKRKIHVQRLQPVKQTQILNFPQGPNGATSFAASESGVMTARPQRVFQTKRFVISSAVAPFFAIGDLLIGRDSMLVNSEYASAEVFSQTGVGVSLEGFIARPGIDITLNAINLDSLAAHAFYGTIIGPALV
jgi:hypothetical protein